MQELKGQYKERAPLKVNVSVRLVACLADWTDQIVQKASGQVTLTSPIRDRDAERG